MAKGNHHLTYEERCQIEALKKRNLKNSKIAEDLGVDRSTIYRELKRNSGKRGYRYKQAQGKADARRQVASRKPKKMNSDMIAFVISQLEGGLSPEQISGRMKLENKQESVSHETIYQHIWADKQQGGTLYKHLRRIGKKYNRRRNGQAGRGCIPNRVGIEKRPAIVEKKVRFGDFELDTIIGANHKGAIVSIVDRATKFTKLFLVSGKTEEEVSEAIIESLWSYRKYIHTLTSDNGKEFAGHEYVSSVLNADFFFARPYHSWERGLNEHTNGLVRQYFPKKTSFEDLTQEEVFIVESLLNNRPRKVLGFLTPLEALEKKISAIKKRKKKRMVA